MDFFEKMVGSFSTAGQDVAKKAKVATESMKLNNQIKANEKMVEKLIYQVGLICFQNHGNEGGTDYDDLFQEIFRLKAENESMEKEIHMMTAEKVCPTCGAKNALNVNFCIQCGTNLKNVEQAMRPDMGTTTGKVCAKCGSVNEEGAMFCVECGSKLESVEQPIEESDNVDYGEEAEQTETFEVSGNRCTNCGSVNEEGAMFCVECGSKLENREQPTEE